MKMKVAAVIIASYLLACVAFAFSGDTKTVTVEHTVKTGDSMWTICNRYYIEENNTESFNAFFNRAVQENGSEIKPGQVVTLKNEVKK